MKTDFSQLLPKKVLFNLKELEQYGIIKVSLAKKLAYKRELETVKIGNKIHVSYTEILRYLDENLITVKDH